MGKTMSVKMDKETEYIISNLPSYVNKSEFFRNAVKSYNPLVGEKGYRKNVKKQLGY